VNESGTGDAQLAVNFHCWRRGEAELELLNAFAGDGWHSEVRTAQRAGK
jgi:hypothetical protein